VVLALFRLISSRIVYYIQAYLGGLLVIHIKYRTRGISIIFLLSCPSSIHRLSYDTFWKHFCTRGGQEPGLRRCFLIPADTSTLEPLPITPTMIYASARNAFPRILLTKSFRNLSLAAMATPARFRFAPLDTSMTHLVEVPKLQGIVFDVDGTLWYSLSFP